MMACGSRDDLARRASALAGLAGPRSQRAIAGIAGGGNAAANSVPLSAILSAPEWLCLPSADHDRLVLALAAVARGAALSDSIDGKALDAYARCVGPDLADWALDATDALPLGGWPDADLRAIGRGMMAAALGTNPATAPLAGLLGSVPNIPTDIAAAAFGPALAFTGLSGDDSRDRAGAEDGAGA